MMLRGMLQALLSRCSEQCTYLRTDVLTNVLPTKRLGSPLSDVRADALQEVLEIRQRWDVQAAYRDGQRDMAATVMLERAGSFWGKPFTLTVSWPLGEPEPELWDATRSIAAAAKARA